MDMDSVLALDIETTGLDPRDHTVMAVGVADARGSRAFIGDESDILQDIEHHAAQLGAGSLVVTWNGEEFDLPFLKCRFDVLNIATDLTLRPKDGIGKYGKPLYHGTWGTLRHVDIAPMFRVRAEELGVRWSLKPVTRALLGLDPVEVDNTGESIAAMDSEMLTSYVLSDARITFALASHLNEEGKLNPEPSARSRSAGVT